MTIFCIGSINIDHYYACQNIVRPGESIPAQEYSRAIGGKGLNQAFALYKVRFRVLSVTNNRLRDQAGIRDVQYHGIIGNDGHWMLDELKTMGFPCDWIRFSKIATGHTIIQTQEQHDGGSNAVILYHGANHQYTEELMYSILDKGSLGDWLVIQAETNYVDVAINYARRNRGMKVLFNPAPYPPRDLRTKYQSDWIILNKVEALCIATHLSRAPPIIDVDTRSGLEWLLDNVGSNNIIVTLGEEGCCALLEGGSYHRIASCKVPCVIDTTGAGDVFLGFFLAHLLGAFPNTEPACSIEASLQVATAAAALAVTKMGALVSIPSIEQVESLLREQANSDK